MFFRRSTRSSRGVALRSGPDLPFREVGPTIPDLRTLQVAPNIYTRNVFFSGSPEARLELLPSLLNSLDDFGVCRQPKTMYIGGTL